MLDRLVTQIEPPPEHLEEQKSRAFHDFLDCHNIIFWFGEELGGQMPSPLRGGIRPDNTEALEEALQLLIPRDKMHCLDVIVLDVTPPAGTNKLQKHRKRVARKEA